MKMEVTRQIVRAYDVRLGGDVAGAGVLLTARFSCLSQVTSVAVPAGTIGAAAN
jgi:hypothetical protein